MHRRKTLEGHRENAIYQPKTTRRLEGGQNSCFLLNPEEPTQPTHESPTLSLFCVAITEYHRLGNLEKNLFFTVLETGKSNTEVPSNIQYVASSTYSGK